MSSFPSWLNIKSRKVKAGIMALVVILLTAWVNDTQVDWNEVIRTVGGIAMAYMGSVAWEDGKRAEAQAKKEQGGE